MNRVREWLGLIALTGAAQVIVQGLGFVCGILVIRLLPVQEYAFYTLANTMLGTMVILADGGINTGVMSQSGKVWHSKKMLGVVYRTGLDLRKRFAFICLLVIVPIVVYLLRKNGASWLVSVLTVLSLAPAFLATLTGSLLEIPPKLHQDLKPMQRYQVESNLLRLMLLAASTFIFPFAAVAILAGGLGQTWNNFRLKKLSFRYADQDEKSNLKIRNEIMALVKKQFPISLYFCFSSQLSIWILTFFGSVGAIAEVGALGRISAALVVIQSLITMLIIPRFSRKRGEFVDRVREFVVIKFVVMLICLIIILLTMIFQEQILKVLGESYAHAKYGLVLSVGAACIGLLGVTTNQLLGSKGIVVPAKFIVGFSILAQVVFAFIIRPTDVNSVLLFNLLSVGTTYLIRLIYIFMFELKAFARSEP